MGFFFVNFCFNHLIHFPKLLTLFNEKFFLWKSYFPWCITKYLNVLFTFYLEETEKKRYTHRKCTCCSETIQSYTINFIFCFYLLKKKIECKFFQLPREFEEIFHIPINSSIHISLLQHIHFFAWQRKNIVNIYLINV